MNYKQLCIRCKKNYVSVQGRKPYAVCIDCQMKTLRLKVEDPKMKELFDIPEEYYRKSEFLRDLKIDFHRFGNLTEKQIAAFKETVEKLKENLS